MLNKYDPDAFHHHTNFLVRFIETRRVKAIFRMMNIKKNDYLIEIGCGAGNVIEKAPCGKLFGVDISPSILLKAKQRLNKEIDLFQADAQNLPCKDQAFMEVICSEVLEHLLDPSVALDEIARILRTEGTAIISIPKKGSYSEMPERMSDEWHLHVFTLVGWLDLFRRLFRVTRIKKIPFTWIPLRYVVRLEKLG
jgi:ubiquinone/menaquinone biosynthesis C-methylase UbiE